MRKFILVVFTLILLTSCATSKQIVLPSGNIGHSINCSGTAVPASKCIEKAGEVCPQGYSVVTSHNERGAMTNFNGGLVATSHKGIVIECK